MYVEFEDHTPGISVQITITTNKSLNNEGSNSLNDSVLRSGLTF